MADTSRLTTERSQRAMAGTRLDLSSVCDRDILLMPDALRRRLSWLRRWLDAGASGADSNAVGGVEPAVAFAMVRKREGGRP